MTRSLTYTEENYLKALFTLGGETVSTTALASHLATKASSITDMLKKLHEKQLVSYVKYQGAALTEEGRRLAVQVVRKHRLWEVFLVDKLGFGWHEVHEIAEELEHIQSAELVNRLDAFLQHPQFDPHGDPIPDQNGVIPESDPSPLSLQDSGEAVTIIGVKDSAADFLQFLAKHELTLGREISVREKLNYDGSMVVETEGKSLNLSAKICENILVR